jgi:hypothetical protein
MARANSLAFCVRHKLQKGKKFQNMNGSLAELRKLNQSKMAEQSGQVTTS